MMGNNTIVEGFAFSTMPSDLGPFAVNVYRGWYGYPHAIRRDPQYVAGIYQDELLYRIRVYPKREVYQ